MKEDYQTYISNLYRYYMEFLSRSPRHQARLKEYSEITQELKRAQFKPLPAKIVPGKKRKPLKPHELKKPVICSSGSRTGQGVWDRTKNFICDSNRVILEVDIEKPPEELYKEIQEIIKPAQEQYWKEMNDENCFGEYRYLKDFKRDSIGRKDTYPFDEWKNYLKIFDLRTNIPKIPYKEIAKIIFKDDAECHIDNAKKAFKKANQLIKAAEENRFPPKKLKISSKQ